MTTEGNEWSPDALLEKVRVQPQDLTSSEQEENIAWLRSQADASLYVFAKGVMQFPDLVQPLHAELGQIAGDDATWKRRLILVPRGHFKTTVCTIAGAAWRACKNSNTRVLIANATQTNATKFLTAIKLQFENNSLLRLLYPEVIPDFGRVRWNSMMLELKRPMDWPEATIECIGVGGKATSRHYDVLILDDLINEDTPHTRDTVKSISDWYKYSESLFIDPANGILVMPGTRYWHDDIYSEVIENESIEVGGNVKVYTRECIENGQPIFPERFTHAALAAIQRKQGTYIFSCQYHNKPTDDKTAIFKHSQIRWVDPQDIPPVETMNIYMRVDLAVSEEQTADDTVITVGGIDKKNDLYILDMVKDKMLPEATFDAIAALFFKWPSTISIGIEAVSMQKAFLPFFDYMSIHEDVTLPIIPIERGGYSEGGAKVPRSKFMRIIGCQWRFEGGHIFFSTELDYQDDIINQITRFPRATHDDILDTIADFELETTSGDEVPQEVIEQEFQLSRVKRLAKETLRGRGYADMTAQIPGMTRRQIIQMMRRQRPKGVEITRQ